MPNSELFTVKAHIVEVRAELGLLKDLIKAINEDIKRHEHTLYGNGTDVGLLGLKTKVVEHEKWKIGWQEVMNYNDFLEMKVDLRRLVRQSYILTAIIIIAVFSINIVGPSLASWILPPKKVEVVTTTHETEFKYIYRDPKVIPGLELEKKRESFPEKPAVAEDPMYLYRSAPDQSQENATKPQE